MSFRIEYVEDRNGVSERFTNIENAVISLINLGIEQMNMVGLKDFHKHNGTIAMTVIVKSLGEFRVFFNCHIIGEEVKRKGKMSCICFLVKLQALDTLEIIREIVLKRISYKEDDFQELAEKYIKLDHLSEEIKVFRN